MFVSENLSHCEESSTRDIESGITNRIWQSLLYLEEAACINY
jgi:hypothetical protein